MQDEPRHYMRVALNVAAVGLARDELPIGAVVVLDGRILATAHTAEVSERRRLVHAELLALEAADRIRPFPGRRADVQLFTTLEPCLLCFGAAHLVSGWQRDPAAMPSLRLPQVTGGLLRAEAQALFRRYVARHSSGPLWEWAKYLAEL
jgi:tRNA(adenine34) deaminase